MFWFLRWFPVHLVWLLALLWFAGDLTYGGQRPPSDPDERPKWGARR